jgi:2-polyprenyl-3-methyl-5-hydroxy-6-metoxy-1,4-benzoquinol methylase
MLVTHRFGQVQRLRRSVQARGKVAELYVRLFGSTSLFALNCYWLLARTITSLRPRPRRILDAGCGKGDFAFAAAALMPDAEVLGIDVSTSKTEEFARYEDNIVVCQRLADEIGLRNVRFEQRDLLSLDAKEEFDLIFSIHVLEHIAENERVVANLGRALKPGGYLYVQMPSRTDLSAQWLHPYLSERLRWEKVEHIALRSRGELEAAVRGAGLEIRASRGEVGYLLTLVWQAREALVEHQRMLLGAALLPPLKGLVYMHRLLADRVAEPYRRLSLRLAGASEDVEGNLELLAQKPLGTSRERIEP